MVLTQPQGSNLKVGLFGVETSTKQPRLETSSQTKRRERYMILEIGMPKMKHMFRGSIFW